MAFRPFGDVIREVCLFLTHFPHRHHRLLVCQTHQPLFGTSFRTCHRARTRPARWRGICNGACVCFFRTLRRLFSSFSNSENLQILRRTPAQHPTCEFEGAHRLSSFSKPRPLSVERARTRVFFGCDSILI